jgi:NAD-dependent dihydropyrimidine dehydrogenase PreA subunit
MSDLPNFDQEKCNGCLLCISVCLQGGFAALGTAVVFNAEAECDYCQQCEIVCPTGAISFPFEVVDGS